MSADPLPKTFHKIVFYFTLSQHEYLSPPHRISFSIVYYLLEIQNYKYTFHYKYTFFACANSLVVTEPLNSEVYQITSQVAV